MPATKDQKQFLHSLACYLAKDHDGFRDDGAAKRAQILDSGVFSHFWFNWQPIGVTVNAVRTRSDPSCGSSRRVMGGQAQGACDHGNVGRRSRIWRSTAYARNSRGSMPARSAVSSTV